MIFLLAEKKIINVLISESERQYSSFFLTNFLLSLITASIGDVSGQEKDSSAPVPDTSHRRGGRGK